MFRRIRIAILLLVLLIVGLSTLLQTYYSTRWDAPFVVALYASNGDRSTTAERYIDSLTIADFASLEKFFQDEAHEFGVKLDRPIQFVLGGKLNELPPLPPTNSPNVISIMMWSLHFRWWAWNSPPKPPGPTPRIRIFMIFYDSTRQSVLDHSTGLAKGRIGIAHLFAIREAAGSNLPVIGHELLHTLGATDKYDPTSTQPHYPDGFAEPDSTPRYPQRFAELMGGRIPVSATEAAIPTSLEEVLIGPATAVEIGWKRP